MSRIKKRLIGDAGIIQDPKQPSPRLFDIGGRLESTPVSSFAITETVTLISTMNFLESPKPRLNIADGDVRPGTTR